MAKNNPKNGKADSQPAAKNPMLSEESRNALFAILALAAVLLASYVLFLSPQADNPADGREFYSRLVAADRVGFLYDVRGANAEQTSAIYQCGVDMISRGRFVGKELENIGCSDDGCIVSSTDSNGTSRVGYDEARRMLSSIPYILIKPGEPSYNFFQRHMEISIGPESSGNVTCDISAIEG